jgi:hypothetical protein
LFDDLTSKGIDLTNVESVNSFLAKLNEVAPDLAQLFQGAIEALLQEDVTDQTGMGMLPNYEDQGGPNMNVPEQEDPNMNIQNQNETLPQGVPGLNGPESGSLPTQAG